MYKEKNIECVLCGKNDCKLTKEHHPTKGLIENKIYCEYLMFPTCYECNHFYSQGEQILISIMYYYSHFYYNTTLKSSILKSFERDKKLEKIVLNFYNNKESRQEIKTKYIYPIMIKYAKIHNYICQDYYNDELEVKVSYLKFLDEMTKEEYEQICSPEKIELLCEEMQLDYFGRKIFNSNVENYLSSNYFVSKDDVYMDFNDIYPHEYKFLLYQDKTYTNIKHLKLVIKDILFCKLDIVDNLGIEII